MEVATCTQIASCNCHPPLGLHPAPKACPNSPVMVATCRLGNSPLRVTFSVPRGCAQQTRH